MRQHAFRSIAVEKYEEDKRSFGEDNAYDKVFCVFDRDKHGDFDRVIKEIDIKGKPFVAIPSYPCFEIWVLFHFEETTREYKDYAAVASKLKKHISNYSKITRAYPLICERTNEAIKRAKSVYKQAAKEKIKHRSSLVYVIVEDLFKSAK